MYVPARFAGKRRVAKKIKLGMQQALKKLNELYKKHS
jgi:hypothetical protein